MLKRALDNLLRNALRFSPADQPVLISVQSQGQNVTLSVRDHGPGVASEYLEQLGKPFFRAPGQSGSGHGLGLAIARRAAPTFRRSRHRALSDSSSAMGNARARRWDARMTATPTTPPVARRSVDREVPRWRTHRQICRTFGKASKPPNANNGLVVAFRGGRLSGAGPAQRAT